MSFLHSKHSRTESEWSFETYKTVQLKKHCKLCRTISIFESTNGDNVG